MAKQFNIDSLFDNYFDTAKEVFMIFENTFGVDGAFSKIMGVSDDDDLNDPKVLQIAKDHVRASYAWSVLLTLYDYAVEGIAYDHPIDIVIGGAEVLSFLKTENVSHSNEWEQIIALGDGRYALDDGDAMSLEKLALLADVDTRTVRNAISAGELSAEKSHGNLWVENASARSWLYKRRNFKPTVVPDSKVKELNTISTASEFGLFLSVRRTQLGIDNNNNLVVFHPNVDAKSIAEIEQGIFRLPIDTIFPIADFYQLDRKELLACVMRVFFSEQLSVLRQSIKDE